MKLVNYNRLSMAQLKEKYWDYEIEIAKIAYKYHQEEEYIIKNSYILSTEDKHQLGVLLWEVVNCLQCYNARKKSIRRKKVNNIIPFPGKKKRGAEF
jgi:hypothetical protein